MHRRIQSYWLAATLLLCGLQYLSGQVAPAAVGTNTVCELLNKYNKTVKNDKPAVANAFFNQLTAESYMDEPIRFTPATPEDSIDLYVWYWAAEYLYAQARYEQTLDYCHQVLALDRTHKDSIALGDTYSLLGAALFRLGRFDEAAEALYHSYEIDKTSGDADLMSSSLNGIASVLIAAKRPQEAEKYMLEAIALNQQTDNTMRRAVLFGNTSEMYHSMGNDEKALQYALQALEIEKALNRPGKVGIRLAQIASVETNIGRTDDALSHLLEAIPLLREDGNIHSLAICLNQMGDVMMLKGKEQDAAIHYREAATLFAEQGDIYNERHSQEGLYKALKHVSPEEALLHLERAATLKDSIYNKETTETVSKYNAIYHNDLLHNEKQQIERRNRIILWVCVGTAFLLSVVAFIVVIIIRRREKSRKEQINTLQNQYEQINRWHQNMLKEQQAAHTTLTEDDLAFLKRLEEAVETELEEGECTTEALSQRVRIDTLTIRRRLADTLKLTPQAYIRQVRMQKARRLLEQYRDMTIAEVAARCGYSQLGNFTRAYQNYYGIVPTAARANKSH